MLAISAPVICGSQILKVKELALILKANHAGGSKLIAWQIKQIIELAEANNWLEANKMNKKEFEKLNCCLELLEVKEII